MKRSQLKSQRGTESGYGIREKRGRFLTTHSWLLTSFLILFLLSASTAFPQDYQIRVKSLDVSKVSEEHFQIKGEIVNNTNGELARISIKFRVYDPSGEIIQENQILPFVNPVPPRGSSPFLLPIRYSRNMEMEKVTMHFINLVGNELSVDPNGYSLEIKAPK